MTLFCESKGSTTPHNVDEVCEAIAPIASWLRGHDLNLRLRQATAVSDTRIFNPLLAATLPLGGGRSLYADRKPAAGDFESPGFQPGGV